MLRLDPVVGPNGSGKSTFVRLTLTQVLPAGAAFVNADEIARQRWPDDPRRPRLRGRADRGRYPDCADRSRAAVHRRDRLLAPVKARRHRPGPRRRLYRRLARAAGARRSRGVPGPVSGRRGRPHRPRGQNPSPVSERLWPLVVTAMSRPTSRPCTTTPVSPGPQIVAQLATGAPSARCSGHRGHPSRFALHGLEPDRQWRDDTSRRCCGICAHQTVFLALPKCAGFPPDSHTPVGHSPVFTRFPRPDAARIDQVRAVTISPCQVSTGPAFPALLTHPWVSVAGLREQHAVPA